MELTREKDGGIRARWNVEPKNVSFTARTKSKVQAQKNWFSFWELAFLFGALGHALIFTAQRVFFEMELSQNEAWGLFSAIMFCQVQFELALAILFIYEDEFNDVQKFYGGLIKYSIMFFSVFGLVAHMYYLIEGKGSDVVYLYTVWLQNLGICLLPPVHYVVVRLSDEYEIEAKHRESIRNQKKIEANRSLRKTRKELNATENELYVDERLEIETEKRIEAIDFGVYADEGLREILPSPTLSNSVGMGVVASDRRFGDGHDVENVTLSVTKDKRDKKKRDKRMKELKLNERNCLVCGTDISEKKVNARFCSGSCRAKYSRKKESVRGLVE